MRPALMTIPRDSGGKLVVRLEKMGGLERGGMGV
jgi:hypothetical protein